jgi:sec-independent protein translocase protein TatA
VAEMISATEWIVIIILLIALLIFGPSKIPELARAIGRARREYEKALREDVKESEEKSSSEDKIFDLARKLGIKTEGKTRDEILGEIEEKLKELKK